MHSKSRDAIYKVMLAVPSRRMDIDWLVEETGVSRSQVGKELKALVNTGYLHPTTRKLLRPGGLKLYYELGKPVL